MAARAHARLMQEGRDQAIVISGESGAGKTETAKFLLQYLARVASAGEETLQARGRHRRRRRRRHHHHATTTSISSTTGTSSTSTSSTGRRA